MKIYSATHRAEKVKTSAPTNSGIADTMLRVFNAQSAAFNPYKASPRTELENWAENWMKAVAITDP